MTFVADLTLTALDEQGTEALPAYAESLRAACAAHEPPFGMAWYGEKFRSVASDANWLAGSLIANAEKEGEGARKLWALAGRTEDTETSEKIRLHAVDESQHALLYLTMLDIVFPDAVSDDLRPALDAISPRYTRREKPEATTYAPIEHVLDELVQMNIGEIRTRIHQLLLRPVIIAHCPLDLREKIGHIMDSLLLDETRHIQYTARLIERFMAGAYRDFLFATTAKRLAEFSNLTLQEAGEHQFVGE